MSNHELKRELEETKKKLKNINTRFERFMTTIPAVFYEYIMYPEDNRSELLYMSAHCEDILGAPPEYFIGDMNKLWGMIHPDDLAELQETDISANRKKELFIDDFRVILPSNQEKWIRASSLPHPQGDKKPDIWIGFMIDFTDRMRVDRELCRAKSDEKINLLSKREKEVLTHVSRGLKNSAIADSLFITEKTVKSHLYNIYDKLGVRNRHAAALMMGIE